MLLKDRDWKLKYTPDDGDLVGLLYVPLLSCAMRYDRLTGYFSASALSLAARGIEWLVANGGRIRMIVGCTLEQAEVSAIEKGETVKEQVEKRLLDKPLDPPDIATAEALELLAWLVSRGQLEIRVAVPCDNNRRPIPAQGLFHEKSGIVEDRAGYLVAFNGSLNETAAGWTRNWESLNVFTSWRDPERVNEEQQNFARIWANQAKHALTLDIPSAVRDDLLRFMPQGDVPARMKAIETPIEPGPESPLSEPPKQPAPVPVIDPAETRRTIWDFISYAPRLKEGGIRVGEVTSAITPWPHQVRAFHRLYDGWAGSDAKPPKLLIADEVGLGKTIQAGLLLRQAWLAGQAKRILILAPKNVCRQWQIELREKFNLNWPIYDGQKLTWYPSPGMKGRTERVVSRKDWHEEPIVIASSHLMRRADRQPELLSDAEPWDLIVLDEAHHARRKGAGGASESGPNALLSLMRGLRNRTKGLVLLTATPMQVHPVEVFDLLNLLGMPPDWTEDVFLKFFERVMEDSPSHQTFDWLAEKFRSVEKAYGEANPADLARFGLTSGLKQKKILKALRDAASIPRRQLETDERNAALRLIRFNSPINRLISRHTRELLRKYHKAGKLKTRIADRNVEDRFIELSPDERRVYEAIEDYIATTYNQATDKEKHAVGFVMTIYRRRLASSFYALANTLQGHLEAISGHNPAPLQLNLQEDVDATDDDTDVDEAESLEQKALAAEEKSDIERLLAMIKKLPPDTKLARLKEVIHELRERGYRQVMVFTQFTDTMDFLRRELQGEPDLNIMCFSGRGGEVMGNDGRWKTISRDDVKKRFREGKADVLLCTDAAAEGLNFQFCGSLINYDLPWNPMRVEQRIGRVDRLGQKFEKIRIFNLHYADTVETDVYQALRSRIGLFESVVGRLQPILAKLPTLISGRVLQGRGRTYDDRADALRMVEADVAEAAAHGFDIDEVTDADLVEPIRPDPPLTMDDLDKVISRPPLLPPGDEASPMNPREFKFVQPGLPEAVRVTTDPAYFEENADSIEFWSPGNPVFPALSDGAVYDGKAKKLRELLD
jgi:SNF2 family DNA or RNA helicase